MQVIDNSPALSDKNTTNILYLRGILSSSGAIKRIDEDWLVEADLSLLLKGMTWFPLVSFFVLYLAFPICFLVLQVWISETREGVVLQRVL